MSYHDKNIQSPNSVSYINDGSSNNDSRPPTPEVYLTDEGPSNNDSKPPTPEVYLTDDGSSSGITTFMDPGKPELESALLEGNTFKQAFAEFGRAEDYIELNIYNTDNDLITHIRDFRNYSFEPSGINPLTGFSNGLIMDPSDILNDLNFNAGDFKLEYRFQRKKIFNSFQKIFFIKEISNSRQEIRIESNELNNSQLEQRYKLFEQEIRESQYLKDFTLNFGNSINILAINIALDKSGEKY